MDAVTAGRMLDHLEREVEHRLARLHDDEESLRHDRADGTADDEHDPEGTPLSAEWSRMAGVRDALARSEHDLAAARTRLAAGDYGDCARCGRPIGAARLEARPTADLCITCARAAESRRR